MLLLKYIIVQVLLNLALYISTSAFGFRNYVNFSQLVRHASGSLDSREQKTSCRV